MPWSVQAVGASIPAGSLRWDKLVKSSLASSMAGFISGGKLGSLPVWMARRVVSTVFFCAVHRQPWVLHVWAWPLLVVWCVPRRSRAGTPASPCPPQSACRQPRRQPSRRWGRAAMPGCRSRRCAPWWWSSWSSWSSCPAPSPLFSSPRVVGASQGPRLLLQKAIRTPAR